MQGRPGQLQTKTSGPEEIQSAPRNKDQQHESKMAGVPCPRDLNHGIRIEILRASIDGWEDQHGKNDEQNSPFQVIGNLRRSALDRLHRYDHVRFVRSSCHPPFVAQGPPARSSAESQPRIDVTRSLEN